VSASSLEAGAFGYLARYASSAEHLRRVLLRRVERSVRVHGTDRAQGAAMVDGLVTRLISAGLIDDEAYAEAKALSLHRLGHPPRAIRARLAAKGVARDAIERALARLAAETAEVELAAACRYVRRRRLGPYRPARERDARRDKDLAALSRAGFGLALARRVLSARDADEIEEMLRESS
jgi:regulatory protein